MRTLVLLLFVCPVTVVAVDRSFNLDAAEEAWIEARNAEYGRRGYPAGFGLRPEAYDLDLPRPTNPMDPRFDTLCADFGRELFVALGLQREGRDAAAINARAHIERTLAKLNLLQPPAEADRAVFEKALGGHLIAHLRRAAKLAGVTEAVAAELLFNGLQLSEFTRADLRRATNQTRSEWRLYSRESVVYRVLQFGIPAAASGVLVYLANDLWFKHAGGELVLVWGGAVVAGFKVAKYVLPITRRFDFKHDHAGPALRACQRHLAPSRFPVDGA